MKTVVVTGAAGFMGRHVCEHLFQNGFTVIGIASHRRRAASGITNPGYSLLAADLGKFGELQSALLSVGIRKLDAVVHLAARLSPTLTGEVAERAAETNRLLDENVLRFCGDRRIPAVYASGTVVYGFGRGEAQVETSKVEPSGPYAEAKLIGEQRGLEHLSSKDVPFTVLRICAPYGPFQDAQTVLRIFMHRASRGLPLLYHGSGSRQQDFTFIDDVADAFQCALRVGANGIYNIAAGAPVSMRQLAELIRDGVPGCRSEVIPSGMDDPQEGVSALFPTAKASVELGWRPKTTLPVGLTKCLDTELLFEPRV